jgi:hypothetical protein
VFRCEQRDDLHTRRGDEQVHRATAAAVDAGVIGDQPDATATNEVHGVGEEGLDAGEHGAGTGAGSGSLTRCMGSRREQERDRGDDSFERHGRSSRTLDAG